MRRKNEREVKSFHQALIYCSLDSPSLRKLNMNDRFDSELFGGRRKGKPREAVSLLGWHVLCTPTERNGVIIKQTEEEFPRERNKKPRNRKIANKKERNIYKKFPSDGDFLSADAMTS